MEQLRHDLTAHLSPIAKLAIDRESGSATSLEDLYRRLSEHLPATHAWRSSNEYPRFADLWPHAADRSFRSKNDQLAFARVATF